MISMELKCPGCGGPLSFSDTVCPYCGSINEKAKGHIADKEKYGRAYAETAGIAKKSFAKNRHVKKYAILLALILVCFLALLILRLTFFNIHVSYLDSQAAKNVGTYSARLESYLEEEDYLAFYSFFDYHRLRFCNTEAYERYYMLYDLSMAYHETVTRYLMKIAIAGHDSESDYGPARPVFSSLALYLSDFYEAMDITRYTDNPYSPDIDRELSLLHAERMDEYLSAQLKTLLNASNDDLELFRTEPADVIEKRLEELYDEKY